MPINYPTFLKEVDQLTSRFSTDTLKLFIHDIARTTPENNRQQFLAKLNDYCKSAKEAYIDEKEEEITLDNQINTIYNVLDEIQTGKRELKSEYNLEWDGWYDDDIYEYNFSDPNDILDAVSTAIELLHKCLDHEQYEKGAQLALILSFLKVQVSGDYRDGTLGIKDLIWFKLLNIDLDKVAKEALYLAYIGNKKQDRAETMLAIMDNFNFYSFSIEEILKNGSNKIKNNNLKSFLPFWIEALAKRPEIKTDKLLEEAQNLQQNPKAVLDNASRYAESHPILYRNILAKGNTVPKEMLLIGLRALKEVPINYRMRSSIANLTAKYALEMQKQETAEYCWLEAFRSSPTVANYFQIRLQSQNWEDYSNKVRDIYSSYYDSKDSCYKKEQIALMFFEERFDEIINKFMNAGDGIGWSFTFMKEGIALMLLLLNSGKTSFPGLSEMIKIAIDGCSFKVDSYSEKESLNSKPSVSAKFSEYFKSWKAQIVLPKNIDELWLEKIKQWLTLRISAIMSNNRRNSYEECAAFVAAYGEVLESRGESGEKTRIMQQYKMNYSKRHAFHKALRKFGMN